MYKKICIGLVMDSHGAGRIQISADIYGLIEMLDIFSSLSYKFDTFDFSNLPLLDTQNRLSIVAYCDERNIGLRPAANDTYEWRLTREKWNEFSEILLLICEYSKEERIYLKSDAADKGDLQVAFSLDEFNQFQEQVLN